MLHICAFNLITKHSTEEGEEEGKNCTKRLGLGARRGRINYVHFNSRAKAFMPSFHRIQNFEIEFLFRSGIRMRWFWCSRHFSARATRKFRWFFTLDEWQLTRFLKLQKYSVLCAHRRINVFNEFSEPKTDSFLGSVRSGGCFGQIFPAKLIIDVMNCSHDFAICVAAAFQAFYFVKIIRTSFFGSWQPRSKIVGCLRPIVASN